jgi:hypothetical protein
LGHASARGVGSLFWSNSRCSNLGIKISLVCC